MAGGIEHAAARAAVLQVWSDVLGTAVVPDDNFFRLGGTSLQAARVTAALRAATGHRVDMSAMFSNPVAADLAELIPHLPRLKRDGRRARTTRSSVSYQMDQRLRRDAIEATRRTRRVVLAWDLTGPLDTDRLRAAITLVLKRHEVLRTKFTVDEGGVPRQDVAATADLDFRVLDLRSAEADLDAVLADFVAEPFNRVEARLFRASLIRKNDEEWTFALAFDHIVFDAWSHRVLVEELSAHYESVTLPLPAQWRDFVAAQRQVVEGEEGQSLRAYWRDTFANSSPISDYPLRHSGSDEPTAIMRSHELTGAESDRAWELIRRSSTTSFVLAATALNLLLDAATGGGDHVIGTSVANRESPAFHGTIGWFAHGMPVRTRWTDGATVDQVLDTTHKAVADALSHSALPWTEIIRDCDPSEYLQPPRKLTPYLNVQDDGAAPLVPRFSGVAVSPRAVVPTTSDPTFSVWVRTGPRWTVTVLADGAVFHEHAVSGLLTAYLACLGEVIDPRARSADIRALLVLHELI
ncbi:hypothetical protein ALI22I_08210 [Saccharothrix sp. ALI-22-I]|uniref:condensation domain-containing protein n=1 Tax=Saccharothrix sp. ALI-22-I TaxID=1933778 RepID=UPI00097C781E|nr:condensation domain-containing protein [Saccharothrix sp. ALI-22-I]ONI91588.1 hypothetical protein ALI22I_08210 [Saccharothrix sp. ALI-22-I]